MLQSAPGILFTLFAGPLSDQLGRKPLILSALFGYLLLDIIFLFNAVWFFELKVEQILFLIFYNLQSNLADKIRNKIHIKIYI